MSIYAPYIQDSIPAFSVNEATITYTDNPAVGNTYDGIKVRIIETLTEKVLDESIIVENMWITLNANGTKSFKYQPPQGVALWQFYKFQISYYYNSSNPLDPVTWSSVAVGRCVDNLKVVKLEQVDSQLQIIAQLSAVSELIYSYYLVLTDSSQKTFTTETFYASSNNQSINREFIVGVYDILDTSITKAQVIVTTFNGYSQSSAPFSITQGTGTPPQNVSIVNISNNIEIGGIEIEINATSSNIKYQILRTTDKQKYEIITTITVPPNSQNVNLKYLDKSVEHGQTYYYALREVQNSSYSKISDIANQLPTISYFEDVFLVAGSKQLCIRFNPKVSNFKDTILESKQDTIGGKYPFFFRNGDVRYKEISISGLVSYQMDANQMFMKDEELGLDSDATLKRENTAIAGAGTSSVSLPKTRTTSLVDYNIAAERKFKLAVLDWLNDGKPKLFRSPTEGNYIIRLMNISLAPEDKLGRMLHSFSATGYECMDCTLKNMQEVGIIDANIIS